MSVYGNQVEKAFLGGSLDNWLPAWPECTINDEMDKNQGRSED